MTETIGSFTRRSDRIYIRVPVEIMVDFEGAKISYPASTVDFSTLGARVQTTIALVPGENVNFIWRGAKSQSVPSQVIWSAHGRPEQSREAGLQFLQPLQEPA